MSDFLPNEWLLTNFGSVINKVSNGIGGKQNKDNIGIPVSRIETISQQKIDLNKIGYIEEADKKDITDYKLQIGDILFSHINSPTHLGKTALFDLDEVLYHGINLLRIQINNDLTTPKFFNYYCNYFRNFGLFALNAQHAVNQSSINQKKLLSFEIPLPPKAEQEKIAELLDNHLAQVEAIKARLNAIPEILKKFRQSVLADAVSGRLTNNINFQTKKLKDITLSVSDGDHQAPPKASNGVPFLVISDVSNGNLDLQKASRFVPNDYFENLKEIRVPKSGDLLYTVTGSFGIPVIVKNDEKFCFQRHIAIIKPNKEHIDTSYLYYFLKSNLAFKQAVDTATGTAQKTVALSSLRNFDVILPPLKEQKEIVERVEQLFIYTDNLETQITNALGRVNQLTQSILHQAFTGKLTADWRAKHPELITGDNSAEKLLEQIQTAKKPKGKPKSTKKVKNAT